MKLCAICAAEPPRYPGSRIGVACLRAISRYRKIPPEERAELIDDAIVRIRRLQAAGVGARALLAILDAQRELSTAAADNAVK